MGIEHEETGAVTIIRSLGIEHEETGAVTIIRSLGIEHEETGAVTIIRSMVGGGGVGGASNSFFDIAYEMEYELSSDGAAERGWDGTYKGKVTMSTKMGDSGNFQVDSFFDIFTELSMDGGGFVVDSFFDITYSSNSGRKDIRGNVGWRQSNIEGTGGDVDSFFDVFFDITYTDVDPISDTGKVETEIVSMSLKSSFGQKLGGFAKGVAQVGLSVSQGDSFFDIFTELSVDGGNFAVDSFFDVFVEIDLSGFGVDSFFDVYTKLSVDGGAGHCSIMAVRVANPEGESFFDVFVEIDLSGLGDSFFDVFVEVDLSGLSGDSFFDVFVDIDIPDLDVSHKSMIRFNLQIILPEKSGDPDSFFDVFVEIDLPSIGGQSDSFFDVYHEITNSKIGTFEKGLVSMSWETIKGSAGESIFDLLIEIKLP